MIAWFIATFERIVAAALAMVGALVTGVLRGLTAPVRKPPPDAVEEE